MSLSHGLVELTRPFALGARLFRTFDETFENGELHRSEFAQIITALVLDLRICTAE